MDDIARLMVDIDTHTVKIAEANLEAFAKEAQQTERVTVSAASNISRGFVNMGTRTQGASARLSAATSRTRNMGVAAQNASFQVADFFVQIGAGTSVTQALAQQLPQLLGGLGMIGAAAGAAVAVVGGLWHVFGQTEDKAKSFDESLDALTKGLEDYTEMVENSKLSTADLEERFAGGAEAARALYEQLANIEKTNLFRGVGASIDKLIPEFTGDNVMDRTDIRDMFGLTSGPQDRRRVAAQMDLERNLQNAKSLQDQIDATQQLLDNTQALAAVNGSISGQEQERINQLAELLLLLNEVNAKTNEQIQAEREAAAARAKSDEFLSAALEARLERAEKADEDREKRDQEYIQNRYKRISELLDKIEKREEEVQDNYVKMLRTRTEEAIDRYEEEVEARKKADQEHADAFRDRMLDVFDEIDDRQKASDDARVDIAEMERQAEVRRVEAEYGEDSLEAAKARVEAERASYEQMVSTLTVSEELKNEMMAAWDAANGLSESDIASVVGAAADEAGRLSGNLSSALAALAAVESGMQAANRRAMNQVRIRQETVGQPVERAGRLERQEYLEKSGAASYEAIRSGNMGALADIQSSASSFEQQARGLAQAEQDLRAAEKAFADSLKGGKKGGGGGKGKKSDEQREMESDAAKIMRRIEEAAWDAMSAVEKYNHEAEELKILHEAGYLSAEAFAEAMKMIKEELRQVELEPFKAGVEGIADILTEVGIRGESLRDTLANVFEGIAADLFNSGIQNALISQFGGGGKGFGIIGAIGGLLSGSAIKKPSYEGGGKTPSGPRVGGVDGKGGFDAILHPDETIIDHKKGGGSGGVPKVEVIGGNLVLSDNGTIMAEVNVRAANESRRTLRADGPTMVNETNRKMRNQGKR